VREATQGRHPAAEARAKIKIKVKIKIKIKIKISAASLPIACSPDSRSTRMYVSATRPARAVPGAEHRRRRRKLPEGARARCARLRSCTWTYCLRSPPSPRSAGHPAALTRGRAPRSALDFFGYFLWQ
jgi:hypothetical protein